MNTNDGFIHYQQLTSEYLKEACTLLETAFYPHNHLSKILKTAEDPEALLELRDLASKTAEDGVSVIAINKKTNKVVGALFNKIHVQNDHFFDQFYKTWKRPASRGNLDVCAELEKRCNIFCYSKVDCLMDMKLMAVSPDTRRSGVGQKLSEMSLEICRSLLKGVNVKTSVDGRKLSLEPVPKIVTCTLTSAASQKIAKNLSFQIVAEKSLDELHFNGLDFTNAVKDGTKKITLEYLRL